MGGGAAMRAAAKVAGVGVVNGGLRGVVPDHPVSAAARKAVRPVTAIAATSSSDSVKAGVVVDQSSEQKPCWEIDEWEFAGGEEELLSGSGEPMPRLVFGGAPTLQEAKQATSELTVALEKVYLSSPTSTGLGNSNIDGQSPVLSALSNSEVLETKACLNSENILVPSVTKHAIQAFRFLKESPAIQTVVASIASDPNVWNAVLVNPALQDYIKSQKMSTSFSNMYSNEKESSAHGDMLYEKSPRCNVSSDSGESNAEESNSKNGLMDDIWQNIKHTVVDMMSSLSDFFHTFFGGHADDKVSADANASASFLEKALGPSIMGLVVMVIMVVVLKRA